MAAELEELIGRIDSPPALRAEILTHIAYAHYERCAFDQALRTTERLSRDSGSQSGRRRPFRILSPRHQGHDGSPG